jgi:hypothetical protein
MLFVHTRRYNSTRILACSTIDFLLFLSCAHLFELTMFNAFHYIIHPHNLGFPTGLEAIRFHLHIFLTSLSSVILSA